MILSSPIALARLARMKTAPVTDLKNRLSHYLRLVARGETVTVLERGRAIARVTRIDDGEEEIDALVAAGIARAPEGRLTKSFLGRRLPRSRRSVVDALAEDRTDRL